jgi:hypothetical protein
MNWVYDDGGRKDAGYRGETRDCVTRAIAIATGISYQTIYDTINELSECERPRGNNKRSNSRTGVQKSTYKSYLNDLGWKWTPTMLVGQGCKVHLRSDELPSGVLIVAVSRHLTVVKDGVIYDTHDCSRGGTRCVYGYWVKQ